MISAGTPACSRTTTVEPYPNIMPIAKQCFFSAIKTSAQVHHAELISVLFAIRYNPDLPPVNLDSSSSITGVRILYKFTQIAIHLVECSPIFAQNPTST